MGNFILEALEKPFMIKKAENSLLSSSPDEENIIQSLDDVIPTGFFDVSDGNMFSANAGKKQTSQQQQNNLISTYRRIANFPEVADAISEIVDESIFSPGSKEILVMDFKDVPDSIKEKFADELYDITKKIKLDKNIYSMFQTFYVDGQLNIHCAYEDGNIAAGVQKFSIISPINLQFNYTKDVWEYADFGYSSVYTKKEKITKVFDREEIIRVDSGIYSENLILSNLHYAIKTANMLNTLEDMLIPMRFTRSVSRRVFNVDVSNLNNKKAEEVMKKHMTEFKYKKFYDLETGLISNQQHVSSITEDYWFPNRGGEKGTTVETIDETNNLGEINDIIYFKRKLYTALKVPSARINDSGESDSTFDYDATAISREEIKFFNFISRLRDQFLELFYELLKRQVISKGYATESEWEELLPNFSIKFSSENKFFEKMEREKLSSSLELFSTIQEMIGKYYSYEYVYKNVLKLSDDEIREMSEQMENEKTSKIYSRFFNNTEADSNSNW